MPDHADTVALQQLIRHLDVDRRTALVLTRLLGPSYSDAAAVCDVRSAPSAPASPGRETTSSRDRVHHHPPHRPAPKALPGVALARRWRPDSLVTLALKPFGPSAPRRPGADRLPRARHTGYRGDGCRCGSPQGVQGRRPTSVLPANVPRRLQRCPLCRTLWLHIWLHRRISPRAKRGG
jgi:hypothetical protein